jgi:hypothetical protein
MIATDLKINGLDSLATSAPLSLSPIGTREIIGSADRGGIRCGIRCCRT